MRFLGWGCSAIPKRAWSPGFLDGVSPKKPPAQSSLPGSAVSQKPPCKVPIIAKSASGETPSPSPESPSREGDASQGAPSSVVSTLWRLSPTSEFTSWEQGTKRTPPPIQFPASAKKVSREPLPRGSPRKPLPGSPLVRRGLRSPIPASAPSSPPCSSELPKRQ